VHLQTMRGINFTQREIDIISCLLNGRASKKISFFLNISSRTVDTHIRNIMLKLECNSREGIIDFVENCDQYVHFKPYYSQLMANFHFENTLKKISHINPKDFLVLLYDPSLNKEKGAILDQIKYHLSLAGMEIFQKENPLLKNLINLEKVINSYSKENILCILTEKYLNDPQIVPEKRFLTSSTQNDMQRVYYLVLEDGKRTFSKRSYERGPFHFLDQSNYFFSFFDLVRKIYPLINIDPYIHEFKPFAANDVPLEEPQMFPSRSKPKDNGAKKEEPSPKNGFFWGPRKRYLTAACLLSLSLVGAGFLLFEGKNRYLTPLTTRKASLSSTLQRPKLLSLLGDKLMGEGGIQTVALVGPGGAGKTFLARQYLDQKENDNSWELNAESMESLKDSFEKLAGALLKTREDKEVFTALNNIKDPTEKEEKLIQFVRERLKTRADWFLFYDNVEKFSDIHKYFPHDATFWGKGKVIITTRDTHIQSNTHVNHVIQVDELEEDEKLDLFMKVMEEGSKQDFKPPLKEHTITFLKSLPPFPLDICIAAYYLKATNISYIKYLEHLNVSNADFSLLQKNVLQDRSEYSKTRYGIIVAAVRSLMDIHKDFGDLLLLISLIDSQNISKDLLDAYKSDVVIDNFIYHLKKYSLINNDLSSSATSGSSYYIHRSTQEIILAYLTKILDLEKKHHNIEYISKRLEEYSQVIEDKEDLQQMRVLKNHYERILSHKSLLTPTIEGSIECELGNLYYTLGNYKHGKVLLETSLAKLNKEPYANVSRVAQALVYLSNACWDLGSFKEAKNHLTEATLIYQRDLPDNKLGLAKAMSYLGIIQGELENYEKAKSILNACLRIYRDHLPQNYTGITQVLIHLGIIYRNVGEYDKAKEVLEESLLIYQSHLPENYIPYAWALSNLGNINKDMGNYMQAHALYEKSFQLYKKHLPDNQVEIGRIYARLGNVNRDLGNFTKAKELFEKSLKIYSAHLPVNHVAFAWSLAHLGNVHRTLGDYETAKEYLEKSLAIYSKNLPDHYVEVARAKVYLGNVQADLGNYKEAHELFQKCLLIYERNYGRDHLEVARVVYGLGRVYLLEGNINEAEKYLLKALQKFQAADHTEQYLILEDLAQLCLKKSKRAEENKNIIESRELDQKAIALFNQALQVINARLPESSHKTRIQAKLQNIL
jgi:tetratricopeptide (TPR) repeat protein/DNA-binding CsgD family transcriptional regulator